MIDINKIPFDDAKTWKLIQSGYTCGMFQSESPLVQHWLRQIKPKNVWELSAVVAAVRPGVLKSGYADLYVKNKNAGEIESFGNAIVDDIFKSTEGVLLYQEQMMQLGARLAWPNLEEKPKLINVDLLRKAVGKKNQQKILEIGKAFVDGCTANGVDKELSAKLFEVIKNSGRYAFNLSHAMQYAHIAYKTAYLKTHYPLQFISTYLTYAKEKLDKWEEIDRLSNESKIFDIKLLAPNINHKNFNFSVEEGNIRFGLGHIKYGLNQKFYESTIRNLPRIDTWQKFIFLTCTNTYGEKMRSNTTESLCGVGAFVDTGLGRKTLLSLYKFLDTLTPKEMEVFIEKLPECTSLEALPQVIRELFADKPAKRKASIESGLAFFSTEWDHPAWIAKEEKNRLGTIITATSLEGKNISTVDTCLDCIADWPIKTNKAISVIVEQVLPTTTKKGKNPGQKMARISVKDLQGKLDNLPVFPEEFAAFNDLLVENNTVQLDIEMGKSGWVVKRVQQIL